MRQLSELVLNQKPLELPESTPVQEACYLMSERRIGSVLVVDKKGQLKGIFTGRDAVARVVGCGKDASNTVLVDVMTASPTTIPPDKSAIEALRLMWDGGFRHIPVVDKNRILGVVSRGDFQASEIDRLDEERNLWEHMR